MDKDNFDTLDEDEKLALDMQFALDLQSKEEERAKRRERKHAKNKTGYDVQESGGYPKSLSKNAAHMLFVTCEIEQRLMYMLIDSGASTSAISYQMVQMLGLQSHLNTSIYGQAQGIGSASIMGVLENVACQIGHVEFRLYFLVLSTNDPYLILGLDQMRRFKCLIDLETNHLVFGGKDGVSVPFLAQELAEAAAAEKLQPPEQATASRRSSGGKAFSNLFGRKGASS